jgi:hypothetical protein
MPALFAPRRRTALLVAALVSCALLAGLATAPLAQTPTSISLKVKGASVRKNAKFCKKNRKNMRVFRAGTRLKYSGYVRPAPAKHFPVALKIERCVPQTRRFARIATVHFEGKRATGRFKAYYRAPRPRARVTYFKARVEVRGRRSDNRYFGVRR